MIFGSTRYNKPQEIGIYWAAVRTSDGRSVSSK